MYSLAVKRLYLTVPIKAVSFGNGLALVCVCIWTTEVSVLLRQLSVFKGSSGQSCHIDRDNNRMCYVLEHSHSHVTQAGVTCSVFLV